jgi:hypothetical protein
MSKERELLKRCLDFMLDAGANLNPLFKEVNDVLLNQPEQEPVNFDLERMKLAVESPVSDVTVEGLIDKVKSNREHIVDVTDKVEPVAWMQDSIELYVLEEKNSLRGYVIPLYTAPPKREPLTPQQISEGNQSMLNVTRDAFVKGVKFAEKAHGIGVDDE